MLPGVFQITRMMEEIRRWVREFPTEGRSPAQIVASLTEELGEFAGAIMRDKEDTAAEELADLLFVALKAFHLLGLDTEALTKVAEKNSRKTRETCYVTDAGKIVRRTQEN